MYKHPFNWTPAPYTIFKDEALQSIIEEEGYAVVDLLSETEVSQLKELYQAEHQIKDESGGMFYSVYSQDLAYRKRIHNKIQEILHPFLTERFRNYNNCLNFFINKISGENSGFSLHQDSNAIDEFEHSSLSLWIPLQDVDESNGGMWVIERSQKIASPYRSVSFPPPFNNIKDTVKNYLKPVKVKAGQALVFDARIIHTSGTNISGENRLVVLCGMIPEKATFEISFQENEEAPIEVYSQESNFPLEYPNFYHNCVLRPTIGTKSGEGKFVFPQMTSEQFEQYCHELDIKKVDLYNEVDPHKNFITEPVHEGQPKEMKTEAKEAEPKSFVQRLFSKSKN